MSKKTLTQDQKVTDATAFETDPKKLVGEAATWSGALWKRAHQIAANRERAMHQAANWAGVTPNTIWQLRYRPPKSIDVSVYFKLKTAFVRHVDSVEGKIAENLQVLRALPETPARARLVAQMEEFLRNSESEETRAIAERATGTEGR